MYTLEWFWGVFSFAAAFYAMCFMMAHGLEKRSHFWVRVTVSSLLFLASIFLWRLVVYAGLNHDTETTHNAFDLSMYVFYYILGTFALFACYKVNFWSALYCSTIAYCMQHISERIYEIVVVNWLDIPLWAWFLILTAITALLYFLFYFIIIRRFDYSSFDQIVDHKVQLVCSIITIVCAIYINSELVVQGYGNDPEKTRNITIYSFLLSVIICVLNIMLELSFVNAKRANLETERLNELLESEKKQYEEEKANQELLNIKYHDIKHLINSANPNTDPVLFKEIKNTLGLYECTIKTGNEAIDVILSKKAKVCQDKKIKLTCLIDGTKLSALSPYECYSLFENAIDNAIEAVEKCPPEKKIISITQSIGNDTYTLSFINYFHEDLRFRKGLPQTKKDVNYHGYGLKSIKMLAEKHSGSIEVKTNEDLFYLLVHLPLKKETQPTAP